MKCPQCTLDVSPGRAICDMCQFHIGYPNVRFATQPEHRDALNTRVNDTLQQLQAQGLGDAAQQMESLVAQHSRAVMARRNSQIKDLIERDGGVFLTFYQQIASDRRSPEDNRWDRIRKAVDAALFPYYEDQINFLCLSLNDRGVEYYGDFHFSFSDASICHRTTVFQENTVVFCEKQEIRITDPDFRGFVATWNDRGKLALCKLRADVQDGQTLQDLQSIIIRNDPQNRKGYEDFIECHVYGALNVRNAVRITYRESARKEDRVLQKRAVRLLKRLGLLPELIN